jgi:hypothetical protein
VVVDKLDFDYKDFPMNTNPEMRETIWLCQVLGRLQIRSERKQKINIELKGMNFWCFQSLAASLEEWLIETEFSAQRRNDDVPGRISHAVLLSSEAQ